MHNDLKLRRHELTSLFLFNVSICQYITERNKNFWFILVWQNVIICIVLSSSISRASFSNAKLLPLNWGWCKMIQKLGKNYFISWTFIIVELTIILILPSAACATLDAWWQNAQVLWQIICSTIISRTPATINIYWPGFSQQVYLVVWNFFFLAVFEKRWWYASSKDSKDSKSFDTFKKAFSFTGLVKNLNCLVYQMHLDFFSVEQSTIYLSQAGRHKHYFIWWE